jgi:putative tryptophan/tyrosine transport system substrate-binding protein
MRRREFIGGLAGAAAWPVVARTQQAERMRRVGVLFLQPDDAVSQSWLSAFLQETQQRGWRLGRNVAIDYRFANGNPDRLPSLAAEILALSPDVILTNGAIPLSVLQRSTRSVPVVFAAVTEPVVGGFVDSLARPGGNITGFTNFQYSMAGKWLEMLLQMARQTRRVALMQNPQNADWPGYNAAIDNLRPALRVEIVASPINVQDDIERAVAEMASQPNGGLIVLPDAFLVSRLNLLVGVIAGHRLPAIYPFRTFAEGGGLMSYGPNFPALFRGAATYVDRILKGEKPADLPVQAPDKFELVINGRVVKALGLTIPETLLATADEVIQ